jgi:hypothetical protein
MGVESIPPLLLHPLRALMSSEHRSPRKIQYNFSLVATTCCVYLFVGIRFIEPAESFTDHLKAPLLHLPHRINFVHMIIIDTSLNVTSVHSDLNCHSECE